MSARVELEVELSERTYRVIADVVTVATRSGPYWTVRNLTILDEQGHGVWPSDLSRQDMADLEGALIGAAEQQERLPFVVEAES